MIARRYFISGDVQGVGFRYFVITEIKRIGEVVGFVRNLRDGRVEVYAEAGDMELEQLEAILRKGPRGGSVSGVQVEWEMPSGNYHDFRISY
jgi:acylphosphatase